MKRAYKKVDWSTVDWSLTNVAIAKVVGCSPGAVAAARNRFGIRPARAQGKRDCYWIGVDWSRTNEELMRERGCSISAVSSARCRYSSGVKAPRKPGKRQREALLQKQRWERLQEDARTWEKRYNEQTKLAASYFTNPVDKECICEWPDKTLRKVMVTSLDCGMAHVIWNERHAPIDGQGVVVGMEDAVPVAWLYIPANDSHHSRPEA